MEHQIIPRIRWERSVWFYANDYEVNDTSTYRHPMDSIRKKVVNIDSQQLRLSKNEEQLIN